MAAGRRFLACVGWLAAAACAAPPPPAAVTSAPFTITGYAARAPAEIAVLPVRIAAGLARGDDAWLRECAYRELLGKGYTPLATDWVDRALAGGGTGGSGSPPDFAALRSAVDADGFLSIDVERVVRGVEPAVLTITARAVLLDGRSGTILFDHRIEMPQALPDGPARSMRASLDRYVKTLLGPLPARTSPLPGARPAP